MSAGLTDSSIIAATKNQVFCEMGEETIVLSLKDGIYFGLNEVGARIWVWIQEPRTLAEIRSLVMDEYDVDAQQCDSDIQALLGDLSSKGLIEIRNKKNS